MLDLKNFIPACDILRLNEVPVMSVYIKTDNNINFNAATKKFISSFSPCATIMVSKDYSELILLASDIGLNCRKGIGFHNAALSEFLHDKFKPDKIMRFSGKYDKENKCIHFDLTNPQ